MSELADFFYDTAEKLYAAHVGIDMIVGAEAGAFPAPLWTAYLESGIPQMLAPETAGGLDATAFEAGAVLRAAGHHAAPGPLLETLVGNMLLGQVGLSLAERPMGLLFVHSADADSIAQGDRVWTPGPHAYEVAWPEAIETVVIVSSNGTATRIATASRHALSLKPIKGADGEPVGRLDAGPIALTANIAAPAASAGFALRTAALLRASQSLGALEWCLDQTVQYALERKQFGKEIGRFQVVQQHIAELAGEVVAAGTLVQAASLQGAGDEAEALLAGARSRLADAADIVYALSHQVHGAIGFSREHALNFRTRRINAWRDQYGATAYWRSLLGNCFVGADGAEIWPGIIKIST